MILPGEAQNECLQKQDGFRIKAKNARTNPIRLGPIYKPIWALMGPCGPLWAHMGPPGQVLEVP